MFKYYQCYEENKQTLHSISSSFKCTAAANQFKNMFTKHKTIHNAL